MHSIKDLRGNLEKYKEKLSNRNFHFDVSAFEKLDKENRKLISEKEKLEQEKKILSKSKDKSNFEKSKKISEEIAKILSQQIQTQNKIDELLNVMPNIALDDVPLGKDSKSNKLIKKYGIIKKFPYKPKNHIEIGSKKMK